MGTVSDYGGRAYGSCRKVEVRKSVLRSMRCLDCEKLRYVHPRELSRASSPRCLDCGGPLEEIDVSRKRQGLVKKEVAALPPPKRTRRCPGCGVPIADNEALKLHLSVTDECVRYHRAEGKCLPCDRGAGAVIPGTVVVQKDGYKWAVVGLSDKGAEFVLFRAATRYLCSDWVRDEFGPVELAR